MMFYSLLLSSALLVGVATASSSDDQKQAINNLRKLQDATRPPKTPPPTPAATRPPKTPRPTPAATRPPKTPPPTLPPTTPPTPSPTDAAPQSIAETVCADDDLLKLCYYLQQTGLYDILNSDGTYTLFAPSDAAFENLRSMADLTDDEIRGLLMYHIAPNVLTYNDLEMLAPGRVETMVPGLFITVETGTDGEVLLNGKTQITEPDIEASNGIIQVVDQAIIPPVTPPTSAPTTPEPSLKPTEAITPEPTLKPIEAITPEPTLKPTEATTPEPTLKPTEALATLEPSSKPQTESPTRFPTSFSYAPYYPTVHEGVFSKAGKSASKPSKIVGKGSKSSTKSSKNYEIVGKTDKSSDGRTSYYATRDVSVREVFGYEDGFHNARFRVEDLNASSQLRGGSG